MIEYCEVEINKELSDHHKNRVQFINVLLSEKTGNANRRDGGDIWEKNLGLIKEEFPQAIGNVYDENQRRKKDRGEKKIVEKVRRRVESGKKCFCKGLFKRMEC